MSTYVADFPVTYLKVITSDHLPGVTDTEEDFQLRNPLYKQAADRFFAAFDAINLVLREKRNDIADAAADRQSVRQLEPQLHVRADWQADLPILTDGEPTETVLITGNAALIDVVDLFGQRTGSILVCKNYDGGGPLPSGTGEIWLFFESGGMYIRPSDAFQFWHKLDDIYRRSGSLFSQRQSKLFHLLLPVCLGYTA